MYEKFMDDVLKYGYWGSQQYDYPMIDFHLDNDINKRTAVYKFGTLNKGQWYDEGGKFELQTMNRAVQMYLLKVIGDVNNVPDLLMINTIKDKERADRFNYILSKRVFPELKNLKYERHSYGNTYFYVLNVGSNRILISPFQIVVQYKLRNRYVIQRVHRESKNSGIKPLLKFIQTLYQNTGIDKDMYHLLLKIYKPVSDLRVRFAYE